jgi:hypothetical protein
MSITPDFVSYRWTLYWADKKDLFPSQHYYTWNPPICLKYEAYSIQKNQILKLTAAYNPRQISACAYQGKFKTSLYTLWVLQGTSEQAQKYNTADFKTASRSLQSIYCVQNTHAYDTPISSLPTVNVVKIETSEQNFVKNKSFPPKIILIFIFWYM